jgi:hypothetical protein
LCWISSAAMYTRYTWHFRSSVNSCFKMLLGYWQLFLILNNIGHKCFIFLPFLFTIEPDSPAWHSPFCYFSPGAKQLKCESDHSVDYQGQECVVLCLNSPYTLHSVLLWYRYSFILYCELCLSLYSYIAVRRASVQNTTSHCSVFWSHILFLRLMKWMLGMQYCPLHSGVRIQL